MKHSEKKTKISHLQATNEESTKWLSEKGTKFYVKFSCSQKTDRLTCNGNLWNVHCRWIVISCNILSTFSYSHFLKNSFDFFHVRHDFAIYQNFCLWNYFCFTIIFCCYVFGWYEPESFSHFFRQRLSKKPLRTRWQWYDMILVERVTIICNGSI